MSAKRGNITARLCSLSRDGCAAGTSPATLKGYWVKSSSFFCIDSRFPALALAPAERGEHPCLLLFYKQGWLRSLPLAVKFRRGRGRIPAKIFREDGLFEYFTFAVDSQLARSRVLAEHSCSNLFFEQECMRSED